MLFFLKIPRLLPSRDHWESTNRRWCVKDLKEVERWSDILGFLILFMASMVFPTACSFLDLAESDQAAIDSLREAGSDFSKIHLFDFYLYHQNKSGAQKICDELELEGFQVSVQEGALEGERLCLARLNFIPSIETLTELHKDFEDLINIHGGEYDGWETIVIPGLGNYL